MTAHPKIDSKTNELIFFGYQLMKKPHCLYSVISPDGKLYLFNEHHTIKGLYDSPLIPIEEKWMYVRIIHNWSNLQTIPAFFQKMIKK